MLFLFSFLSMVTGVCFSNIWLNGAKFNFLVDTTVCFRNLFALTLA